MEEVVAPHPIRKRKRASIACQNCNSKRIKCNTTTIGSPCSNCRRIGLDCRLIESRRGKRKPRLKGQFLAPDGREETPPSWAETQVGDHGDLGSPISQNANNSDNLELATTRSGHHGLQLGGHMSNHDPSSELQHDHLKNPDSTPTLSGNKDKSPRCASADDGRLAMPCEQLFATDALRRRSTRPVEQVLYSGYTLNLTNVLRQTQSRGIATVEDGSAHHEQLSTEDADSRSLGPAYKDNDLLQSKNAFDVPKARIYSALIKTFFEYVAPHYPIIDRRLFIFQYAIPQRPPSWLLLQAVLFMAAGHCDEKLLIKAGFKSRHDARAEFFKRARSLYDADLEEDKVTVVQAVFLMSFWWPTRDASKDSWHWLGIAINHAVSIGMHRSTEHSDMPLRERRLWKRIWWSLFAEDKHAAASLARPVHIRLNDCDVEPLEVSDFDGEPFGFGDDFQADLPKEVLCYPICLSSLSKILERIIEKPSHAYALNNNSLELCDGMIQVWEAGLAEHLSREQSERSHTIWPSMIHVAACWYRILVQGMRRSEVSSTSPRDVVNQKAKMAASQMIRIVEDLLATSRLQHCPILIVPALVAAMEVYAVESRAGDRISQQLAQVKIRTCLIVFQELQSSWPISGLISINEEFGNAQSESNT